jgi:hypothetical protein
MKDLVLIAQLSSAGSVCCRMPACSLPASFHVDTYIGMNDELAWDSRASGPLCATHLAGLEAGWAGQDVRRLHGAQVA